MTLYYGSLAPIGRACPLQGRGCRFESDMIHWWETDAAPWQTGRNAPCSHQLKIPGVAQWEECLATDDPGSSPGPSETF